MTLGDLVGTIQVMESRHVVIAMYTAYKVTARAMFRDGERKLAHKYVELARAARNRITELKGEVA